MLFLCGVPAFYYSDVLKAVVKSVPHELVAGLPSQRSPFLTNDYIRECMDTLVAFHGGRPGCFNRGLAFLVVVQLGESSQFVQQLHPFSLVKEISFPRRFSPSGAQAARDKNDVIRSMVAAAKRSSKVAKDVTSYLQSRVNRTPFLLPEQHFGEAVLSDILRMAWNKLPDAKRAENVLDELASEFERNFPFTKKEGARGRFMNSKKIWFIPPGRDRHGSVHPHDEPPFSCFLNGVARLGGGILEGFHYDCLDGGAAYKGTFASCHGQSVAKDGRPHLNVYPNDYIR